MDLFLSWDVIWGKNDPRLAAQSDDAEKLRRQSQAIDAAKRVWESFFLRGLGSTISFDGAAGRGQIPAEAIEGLESVRKQIEGILEHAELAVGVGLKLSESDLALKLAMKRGGTVIFYTDEVPKALEDKEEDVLDKGERKLTIDDQSTSPDRSFPPNPLTPLFEHVQKTKAERSTRIDELTKTTVGSSWINKWGDGVVVGLDPHDRNQWRTTVIAPNQEVKYHFVAPDHAKALELAGSSLGVNLHDEPRSALKPLKKADGPEGPPGPKGPATQKIAENSAAAGGGFAGATQPGGAAGAESPMGEASEHSQGEMMANMAEDAPGPIETTHAGVDFQDQMQAAADESESADQQQSAQTDQGRKAADLKTMVVQVLKQIRQQGPVIEQLKLLEPNVYQAITAVTQVMVAMAKELVGIAPVKKAEDEVLEDLFFVQKVEGGYLGRDGHTYDVATATKLSKGEPDPAMPPGPANPVSLEKLEYFRAKDGIRIPVAGHPSRREWDKRYIEKVKATWGHMGELRGRSVDIGQLDTFGSGNPVVNQDRYNLYRRMLRAGDKLPPLVVRRNGLKFDIIDGSHRAQAALDHGVGKVDVIEVGGVQKSDRWPAQPDLVKAASAGECIHFYGSNGGNKCLKCKRTKGEELEKGKLPLPENAPKHTHREWPVGTVKDSSPGGTREVGKVKVQHPETGKTGWVQVRAGQVLSNDGHAISSRNPGGK